MGNDLQPASTAGQLAGDVVVPAIKLILAIARASKKARQNRKICRELAEQVQQVGKLLQSLEEQPCSTIMRRPETRAPLMELHETLRQASKLVKSCRRRRSGCFGGGGRVARLHDMQRRIAFFLQTFPMIAHIDSTSLLVQVIDNATVRIASSVGAQEDDLANHSDPPHDDSTFRKFSLSQLMGATNRFSLQNQIEQGPLATLYKGQLHGSDVTIKKHSISGSIQLPQSMSQHELFKNEVNILQNLQHKNIIGLAGFCAERSEKILVYEYMQNGTLEGVIFGLVPLDWPTRFRIIEGVAQGANYLHNHSRLRVIHRDMKPSNILLDSEMNPRISNFDLATIFSPGMDKDNAKCVVGPFGFVAPEYMKDGTYSVKTDVYSFGVMVLEIISGKRWTQSVQETYYRDLRTWAFKGSLLCGPKVVRRLKNFVHPSLHDISFRGRALPPCLSFPARRTALSRQQEMRRCLRVALRCIQEQPKRRPDMRDVVLRLSCQKGRVPSPRSYAGTSA